MLLLLALACDTEPEAEAPWAPPDEPGPYAAGVTTFWITGAHDEEIAVEVWYPAIEPTGEDPSPYLEVPMAGTAYREAKPAAEGGPFPLIAFSHGSRGIRYQSIYLTEHWAQHGFVVVAPDHPGNTFLEPDQLELALVADRRPGQVIDAVDAVLARTADSGDDLAGLTEGEQYLMAGHSFGAWTTLAVAGGVVDHAAMLEYCTEFPDEQFCRLTDEVLQVPGAPDPRATHALSMAPGGWYAFLDDGLSTLQPAMFWGGTFDEMTPYEPEIRPTWEAAGDPKELWTLDGAGHFVFSDLCLVAPFISDECDDDGEYLDLPTGQDIVRTATTSWLRRAADRDSRDAEWWTEQALSWPEATVE